MKIESENVQIPRALFIQLVKYFGQIEAHDDLELEDRRVFITGQLIEKFEKMKKREEYARSHGFKQ